MTTRWSAAVLVAGALTTGTAAHAQSALVVQDIDPFGLTSLTDELAAQGIPFTVVGSADLATTNLFVHTMLILPSCQPDAVYEAWNARFSDIELFASVGGFVAIHHAQWQCASALVFPQVPGGSVDSTPDFVFVADNLEPSHPLMAGLPLVLTGNPIAYERIDSGLLPGDTLVLGANSGIGVLHRPYGLGNVVVGTPLYEAAYYLREDAGQVMVNELAWGASVGVRCTAPDADGDGLCDAVDVCPNDPADDSDGDGVCGDVDVCPGFDDHLDADGDGIPDGCDVLDLLAPVPGLAGGVNAWSVVNGTPLEPVVLVGGTTAGSVAVPGCPGLVVPFANPVVLGAANTNASGGGGGSLFVPGAASGLTVQLTAVQPSSCLVSDVELVTL
ncbi:MAG: thrombospondin type 3 repeat-containing protein [Alphaproteobacteria bacterium]|nr:thrombospondin type 3 repeat-containing protein [Alphaproteobacteria bacterium]MCB9699900.1 thrombospondin type 3 repeat-containing protein [Alphaproteobacteria bacterium]